MGGFPVHQFSVGELIPDSGGVGIRIAVIYGHDGSLDAEVTSVNDFWSGNRGTRTEGTWFTEGMRLHLVPGSDGSWIIEDRGLPWFSLSLNRDGTKRFEHYR